MKPQWEPRFSMRTDGETEDTTKLIFVFHKFEKAPKNCTKIYVILCTIHCDLDTCGP